MEGYQSAIQIFKLLVNQGEFNRRDNPGLYSEYLDAEVQEALVVLEHEFTCKFLHFDDTVYLVPGIDSEILGIQPAELPKLFWQQRHPEGSVPGVLHHDVHLP